MCLCVYSHYILNTYVRKHVCDMYNIFIYIYMDTHYTYMQQKTLQSLFVLRVLPTVCTTSIVLFIITTQKTETGDLCVLSWVEIQQMYRCMVVIVVQHKKYVLVSLLGDAKKIFFLSECMFVDDEHLCLRVCWMYACQYVCMYAYMYVCMYICICMYAYMYVCMHICMYVDRQKSMHICLYVHRKKLSCEGVSKFRVWAVKWIIVPRFRNICAR